MNRLEFLKILGVSAIIPSVMNLPSPLEVESYIKEQDVIDASDPFWHVRKLLKERALPDWEYYFRDVHVPILDKSNFAKVTHHYKVHVFQNGNHHMETFAEFEGHAKFDKSNQQDLFERLIHGIDMYNSLSPEEQHKIQNLVKRTKQS